MIALLPRFIKSAYRKEPISSFVLIFGAMNIVIGGVDTSKSLLFFGLTLVLVAALIRWWQIQKALPLQVEDAPRRFLPSSSSRTQLPLLTSSDKNRR